MQEKKNVTKVVPPRKNMFLPPQIPNRPPLTTQNALQETIHKSHLKLTTAHSVQDEKYEGSRSYPTCFHALPPDESVSFRDHLSHLDRTFL